MNKNRIAVAVAMAFPLACVAQTAPAESDAPVKSLGTVTIHSGRPTSLPTQIPTTIEGVTRGQIEQTINALDAEDALKYLPSLNVRKRYIGDYTQYGQLDNSYTGVSRYLVADLRLRWQLDKQWSASFGIDNLNNAKYWAFHPYPQRTYVAELKFDL